MLNNAHDPTKTIRIEHRKACARGELPLRPDANPTCRNVVHEHGLNVVATRRVCGDINAHAQRVAWVCAPTKFEVGDALLLCDR